MIEDLAFFARSDLAEIRLHEKRIQFLFVKSARVPRKDFIAMYKDNITKVKWVDSLMTNKKYSKNWNKNNDIDRRFRAMLSPTPFVDRCLSGRGLSNWLSITRNSVKRGGWSDVIITKTIYYW